MRYVRCLVVFFYGMLYVMITSSDDVVTLSIPDVQLQNGQSGEMIIDLSCPQGNCAAMDISLRYDPTVLQVESVNWGEYIVSNADVIPILSRRNTDTGQIDLTFVSTGGIIPPQDKAEVLRLEVIALTDKNTQISLDRLTISNMDGTAITPVNVQIGMISIIELTVNCRLDIDANHIVDHSDLRLARQSFHNSSEPNSRFDVNQDGSVNILDVIAISRGFGQNTDGCES